MNKVIVNNALQGKDDYWNLITSTLSCYEVKEINSHGKVIKSLVDDDYFLVNDRWNIHVVGKIPNFKEQYNSFKRKYAYITFPV
ncbi:hypothetical protein CHH69_12200, partial [Terribacillus saccharophilus]